MVNLNPFVSGRKKDLLLSFSNNLFLKWIILFLKSNWATNTSVLRPFTPDLDFLGVVDWGLL